MMTQQPQSEQIKSWIDDITSQVDAAAQAAGDAAAEEVRATAIVAALNTSRRLQTKIATDSIKQAHLLEQGREFEIDSKVENSQQQVNIKPQAQPQPEVNSHHLQTQTHRFQVQPGENCRHVHFENKEDIYSGLPTPRRRHYYDTYDTKVNAPSTSYYDVISRDFLYEPRNYPHFNSMYSPQPFLTSNHNLAFENGPNLNLLYPSEIRFNNVKSKIEQFKSHLKRKITNK